MPPTFWPPTVVVATGVLLSLYALQTVSAGALVVGFVIAAMGLMHVYDVAVARRRARRFDLGTVPDRTVDRYTKGTR
jgi:hypothetical protein